MVLASTLFLALFTTLAFVPIFNGIAQHAHIMDIPGERKVHSSPIPKSGGPAIALGFCIPVLLWLRLDPFVASIMAGSMILLAAGLVDDILVLGYKQKFLCQTAAALILILYGGIRIANLGMLLPDGVELPLYVSLPLTLLVVVGITNAINLADGLDGLAGGIALMIFLCLCFLAYQSGNLAATAICLAMLGAIFGFLSFNTYPASIFMGDSGSQLLGFVAIALALKVTQESAVLSPVLPLLIIGLPIIDTGIVIWERMRDGRSPFRADKNHVHHKLLKMGLFHTEAVFIIYLTQFMLVSSAYFFRFNSEVYILTFYVVFAGIVVSFFHLSGKYNLTLKRSGFFDTVIKRKLRILKDKESLLRASSFILYSILPVLLITHCALSDGLPRYSSLVSFTAALLMLCFWITGSRMLGGMVRAVLYLMIPAVIYFSQEALPCFPGLNLRPIYLGFFVLCLFSAIMVVRLNRGTNTFHANPMDFLTLIVSLCVLPLLGSFMDAREARVYLVQVIILFYSYEILLNEHRWGITTVTATTIGALLIIALKGVLV